MSIGVEQIVAPCLATFTLEQIKAAFWKEFHKSGDLWFDYLSSEEVCTEVTEAAWRYFEETLRAGATTP